MSNSFVVYFCSIEEPDETGMREVSNVGLSQLLNIKFECVNYITSLLRHINWGHLFIPRKI